MFQVSLRRKEQPAPLRTEKQMAKRKNIPWLALSGGIGFGIGGAIGGAIWFALWWALPGETGIPWAFKFSPNGLNENLSLPCGEP